MVSRIRRGFVGCLVLFVLILSGSVAWATDGGQTEPTAEAAQAKPLELGLAQAVQLALEKSTDIETAELDARLAELDLIEVESKGLEFVSQEALAQAEERYLQAQEAVAKAEIDVARQAEYAYYDLLDAQDAVASARRALDAAETEYEVAKVKFEAGREAQSNVEEAAERVASRKVSLQRAIYAEETERIRFISVLGLPADAEVILTEEFSYQPFEVDLNESISYALQNRDDILTRAEAVTEAEENLAVLKSTGAAPAEIERAEIELRKAQIALVKAENAALLAVRNAYSALLAAADQVLSSKQQLADAQNELAKVRTRFEAGLATANEVQAAESSLADAQAKLRQAICLHNKARHSFYDAIGRMEPPAGADRAEEKK